MIEITDLTVADVMTAAPRCLEESATLAQAARSLLEDGLQAAPVVVSGGEPRGVLSTSDLLAAFVHLLEGGAEVLGDIRDAPLGDQLQREPATCASDTPLSAACKRMVRDRIHRLLVVDDGALVGVLSAIDVVRAVACLDELLAARRPPRPASDVDGGATEVRTWMSTEVLSLAPDAPARAALDLMATHRVRHIVVLDGGALVGIVSDRDVVRVTATNSGRVLDVDGCAVRDIMTGAPLHATSPDAALVDASETMRREKVSALPVVDADAVVGILTSDDVLAALRTVGSESVT